MRLRMAVRPAKLCMHHPLPSARKWNCEAVHVSPIYERSCIFHLRAPVNGKCLHSFEAPGAGPSGMNRAKWDAGGAGQVKGDLLGA